MCVERELDWYLPPAGPALRAFSIAQRWIPAELVHHSARAWVLAERLAVRQEIVEYDREVLFVAAMLHDLALFEPFDAHSVDFEVASGALGSIVAVAFGWGEARSRRVTQTIEAHMRDDVDAATLPEGHLLEAATAADVSGRDIHLWDVGELQLLNARFPRQSFSTCFATAIAGQAARKPSSPAAGLNASGRIEIGEQKWRATLASVAHHGAPTTNVDDV